MRHRVIYEFGFIRIHPVNRTLERDGVVVSLPSRAFDVILLMLMRRGDVVSKEELFDTCWPDTHVDESSLPVMISSIRRAIGDDGRSQKYIQTVARRGYRLVGEVREILIEEPPAASQAVPTLAPPRITHSLWRSRYTRAAAVVLLLTGFTATVLIGGGIRTGRRAHPPATGAGAWYAKGRYAWNLQTKASILQALEYYRKAIAEDPGDALAWAGLAECYVSLPSYSHRLDQAGLGNARAAAKRSLELDIDLAESHLAQGMVSLIGDRNFAEAEEELRKAVGKDPNSSLAQGELGLALVAAGQPEEAEEHARRATAVDPLSIRAATDLGTVLYYSHRFDEAEKEFEDVLKLDPYSYRAHINLGKTYLSLGRYEDARQTFEQASFLSGQDPLADGLRAEATALGGDTDGARSIIGSLEQRARNTYVAPISFAFAYAGLGDRGRVLDNLKKAREDRTIAAIFMKVEPHWGTLKTSAEFQTLTRDLP
jgi:DNA-binding winged helix-turn-helix (wHTH) protein/tetratricopeptide (TPR) repeat protein